MIEQIADNEHQEEQHARKLHGQRATAVAEGLIQHLACTLWSLDVNKGYAERYFDAFEASKNAFYGLKNII